ncbi:hypothetical protein AAUPMC_18839 [Pasteurella multocida subsp. multocida str. Anand1_cattle]|nr:hypothetical protein AAUPMC_18839 [Pasteurella multocida subsp. multocida str. Anand1_cattle]
MYKRENQAGKSLVQVGPDTFGKTVAGLMKAVQCLGRCK